MGINSDAASGPLDNAGSAIESKSLDDAIAAALGGTDETDVPVQLVKEKIDASGLPTDAGDESGSEDAVADKGKLKAAKEGAAPEGNAQTFEAPKHWPDADKQAFAGLPSEAQSIIRRLAKDLEGGFTRKSQELSDKGKFADSIRGLFDDDLKDQLRRAGTDEVGGIQYLVGLQKKATQDPVGYVKWFMQSTGLTPDHLGFSPTKGQPDQSQQPSSGDPKLDELLLDPAVKALRTDFEKANTTIAELQRRLEARDRSEQEYVRQQEFQRTNNLVGMWNSFRGSQDDSGQLAFPHADTLQRQMGALMETDPQISQMADGPDKLKAAYEAALWARPDLRTTLLEQERVKAAADAQKKAEAERAKRTASIRPASGAPAVKVKGGGLDDAITQAMSKSGF